MIKKVMDTGPEEITVEFLIKHRFSSLSKTLQRKIVKDGRVIPANFSLEQKCKSFTRHFSRGEFDKRTWLCASEASLYCWSCLLFGTTAVTWNKTGFKDLKHFDESATRHSKSEQHLRTSITLATFLTTPSIDLLLVQQEQLKKTQHNQKVERNREILKRLIDIACSLCKQELPFRGHDESSESHNRGHYIESMMLLSYYDSTLREHMSSSSVFTGTSNHIQNDLIASIRKVVSDEVMERISKSPFIAIQADETTDVASHSQLSLIVRIVNEGVSSEHFLGFFDVSSDRTAEAVSRIIIEQLSVVGCKEKVVGQTYDGAAVMSSELRGVQRKVRDVFPHATFVHCCSHALNLVLSQSLQALPECKLFFANIQGLANFFSHSTKRSIKLEETVKRRLPRVVVTRWNFHGRLVHVIEHELDGLRTFFDDMLNDPQNWDSATLASAFGYRNTLYDFTFVFFLKLFSRIFAQSDILYDILQKKSFDPVYCSAKVKDFKLFLLNETRNFDSVWLSAFDLGEPETKLRRTVTRERFQRVQNKIIENLTDNITIRFSGLDRLDFMMLLNPEKYIQYSAEFPVALLSSLDSAYPNLFDISALRGELFVTYTSKDFSGKYPYELCSTLASNRLSEVFPQLYRLCCLVICIPSTSASVERSFSKLKRIKSSHRNTMDQKRLSDLSIVSIEWEILRDLHKSRKAFHESVIKDFAKKDRRMDFHYQ